MVVALQGPARCEDIADQTVKLYAVYVIRVPKENWTGTGVYLGNGLVLTAGHVAGEFWRTVEVGIADQQLPTVVLKRGQFSGIDLALLSIDDDKLPVSLRLRRMTVCEHGPFPGEAVIVATPDGTARSRVISPGLLPRGLDPKYRTAITDVATTGNSGSGVFDANRQCLLGIISAKISATVTVTQGEARKSGVWMPRAISAGQPGEAAASIRAIAPPGAVGAQARNGKRETRDIAKYFVPAPVIAAFIPSAYHP
jgi:hypothetical protein